MNKQERQYTHEKQWLSTLMKDKSLFQDKTINENYFYNEDTKNFYLALEKLIKEGTPFSVNIWTTLPNSVLTSIGGKEFIDKLLGIPSSATFEQFKAIEKEIKTYHTANEMIKAMMPLPKKEVYNLEECRMIAQKVNEAVEGITEQRKTFQNLLIETYNKWDTMDDSTLSGVDTGYEVLNQAFDGWQLGDLIIVGARPSMGKTATTVNFQLESSKKGAFVTYIPAETGEESIVKRSAAILGGHPVNAMRNPKKFMSPKEYEGFKQTLNKLHQMDLHIEELHDIREIRQLARELTRKYPDKKHLFVIDHLAHLQLSGVVFQSRTMEYEAYCMELKSIAKEYNIAVMLLSQLSRSVETRENKRPMLSDLRDSGAIEQIADVIFFLYRDAYYSKDASDDNLELVIAKNRDGGTGTITMHFDAETNRVFE